MISFADIYARAAERCGGEAALEDRLANSTILSVEELVAISDDRWLSKASQMIFSAGFNWSVVEKKWPSHEEAFSGFIPGVVADYPDERLHELASDASVIRHGAKISSVRKNAQWFVRVADEYGSFGAMVGNWPSTDFIGLAEKMKKEGDRLGGTTGTYFLRFMGVPSFIATKSVEAALKQDGIIDKGLSTKGGQKDAQAAMNTWMDESGQSLTTISRVLAMSVDT